MWIRGGAGAGKSAIAQTLSEEWDMDGTLAASFYFSRISARRNEKKYFISTFAYQISTSIPTCRLMIEDVIRRTPKIFERNLRTQLQRLIINPLVALSDTTSIEARIVVVDGLDECCMNYSNQDFEQQQKEILECIQWAANYDDFPLRFLIASRPERQIREAFEYGSLKSVTYRIVLDNSLNPAADIELYLRCKLEEIRRTHFHLGSSWPSDDIIAKLVAKSSGHFIYAAVVVRFLASPRMDPNIGLNAVMSISVCVDKANPFVELDALPTALDVFRLMIYDDKQWQPFSDEVERLSPTFVAKYLFLPLEHLYLHLIDLHSILDSPPELSRRKPITLLLASLIDYLTEPTRSKCFSLDKADAFFRVLSLSVQHLYVRALSPDNGAGDEYVSNRRGFAVQTSQAPKTVEPDDAILERLAALVDRDETRFASMVHQVNLSYKRRSRRSWEAIDYLYSGALSPVKGQCWFPSILVLLKNHGIQGFRPVDPANSFRAAIDWFCDEAEDLNLDILERS